MMLSIRLYENKCQMHRNRTALISYRCEMHLVDEKVTAPSITPLRKRDESPSAHRRLTDLFILYL